MTVTKIKDIDAGTIWNKLGILHAQLLFIRNVPMVTMAASDEPVKKNALNKDPSRALSLGYASSDISEVLGSLAYR
jgi:hypothetical protein